MFRVLLPLGRDRLACIRSITGQQTSLSSSALVFVNYGQQTELQRKCFSHDTPHSIGRLQLGQNVLHQSSHSLTQWRSMRNFARRREREKVGRRRTAGPQPWLPEEDQVIVFSRQNMDSGHVFRKSWSYNALIFLQADWLFWQLPFQALFDFVEKFGSGDGRPGPVPKMWKVPFFIFLPIKLHKKSLIWWTMASLRPTQIPLKLYLILPNILIFAGRGGPSGVGQGVSGGSG